MKNEEHSMVVFIDEFGQVVEESKSNYKVVLNGSYSWYFIGKCWQYEIKSIFPKIPLSHIFLYNLQK